MSAYDMRISDCSSDVCSSDLKGVILTGDALEFQRFHLLDIGQIANRIKGFGRQFRIYLNESDSLPIRFMAAKVEGRDINPGLPQHRAERPQIGSASVEEQSVSGRVNSVGHRQIKKKKK